MIIPKLQYCYSGRAIINLPMNQNYYPVDFEAQYEETSEKMIEIANKYKDKIRTIKPLSSEELEQQLEGLQIQIDDHQLQFRKESIYSQFASGQLMAEKRKQPPEMCPECGQELKKQAQCELCAEIFCTKCCCRKRVIPFISKDIRLCCQQCHWKFVKLFDNKNFYEDKEKMANVIHFVNNKIKKIAEKVAAKNEEVEEYKKIKRDEKIKEKALDNKIIQEEKKLKQIQEEFRRVISEKAQKMQEEERRRQREEEQRIKARKAEQERERTQEQQRKNEQQRLRKEKELEQQLHLSASQKKIHVEEREKALLESLKIKEEELKRREDELLKKEQEVKKQLQLDGNSVRSSTSFGKAQTPKQSIGKNSSERQQINDTTDSKSISRSRRGSEEREKVQQHILVATKSTTEQPNNKMLPIKEERQKVEEQPSDALERSLANMFKPKREDDSKSLYSNASKAGKSILDMSVNQLLAVRIPVTRTSNKIEEQQKPIAPLVTLEMPRTEQEILPTRRTMQGRQSIKVEEIDEPKQQDMRMHKDSILRNSSLITSNKDSTAQEVTPEKCSCSIM